MRFFLLTLLLLFSFNLPAYAQDTQAAPSQETLVEPEPKKETVFSKATDKQISEAQNFYKSCVKSKSMSKRKNCKCAATRYLETRVEFGEEATIKEIMAKNINLCLKDTKRTAVNTDHDRPQATEKQIATAEKVLANCQSDAKMYHYIDCECYAATYLQEDIKQGPLALATDIYPAIRGTCKNAVAGTGREYSRCLQPGNHLISEEITPKEYCECYARKWSKLFASFEGHMNLAAKGNLTLAARRHCKDLKNYK